MAAPTLNTGYQSGHSTSNEASTTVTVPTTLAAGDLWFIAIVSDPNNQTFTFPAGFSKEWSDFAFITGNLVESGVVAKKVSSGSDGNASVTVGTSERQVWVSFGVHGGNATLHARGTDQEGSSGTATFPAVTTSVDNCLLVRILFTDASLQTTPFGSLTGWTAGASDFGASSGGIGFWTKTLATAGVEASGTVTLANTEQWYAITFAIAPSSLTVAPSGVADSSAFGTATITQRIGITGIASAEAFGSARVNLRLSPTGLASNAALGAPTVAPQAVTITPSGLASSAALGAATVSATYTVAATGIASGETLGANTVAQGVTATGVASGESYGTTKLNQTLTPVS